MGPERDPLTTDEALASSAETPPPIPWSAVDANIPFHGRIWSTRLCPTRDAYQGRIYE
jgi:hypothetical protein